MEKEKKEENKRRKWLLLLLLLLLLICICVTVWAIFFRKKTPVPPPDYAQIETERNAEPIGGGSSEKLEAPEGGGAVALTYSKEISISLSDKKASLMVANPGKSTQDMVIQLVINDKVIIQSGRVLPGNRVTKLDLSDGTERSLSAGKYEGRMIISFYDCQNGEKAMLDTEIPVNVTVVR